MIFHCPNCGSHQFEIVGDNVVACKYCNRETHFAWNEIDPDDENAAFIRELKESYYEQIEILNQEKRVARACLLHYKKRANPKRLVYLFGIIFVLSLFFLLSSIYIGDDSIRTAFLICTACCAAVSLAGFMYAKIRQKRRKKKYLPYVTYYAAKIVNFENEIATYSKQISNLLQ